MLDIGEDLEKASLKITSKAADRVTETGISESSKKKRHDSKEGSDKPPCDL